MTFTRLLVLGDSHAPERAAAHLASSGVLSVQAGTSNHVPATMEGTALWVGTDGATRLLNAGIQLPLLSLGPAWLSTVPGHLLGRRVLCTTIKELLAGWNGPGMFRLAEQRYGSASAEKVYSGPASFAAEVGKYHHRLGDLVAAVQVIASVPVQYVDRYRIFIADGELSASTRVAAVPSQGKRDDAYEGTEEDRTAAAEHFAQIVLDATVWHQPPGFRIDVGLTAGGTWQLISAGPSWAANFHLANPTGVLNSVLSGQAPDYDHWQWLPDALFRRVVFRSWPISA